MGRHARAWRVRRLSESWPRLRWLLSYVGASNGCFGENVAYVHSGVYDTYRGRVFDYRGRPASEVRLLVSSPVDFDRSHDSATTDRQGRFCVYVLAPSYGIISIAIAGQRNARDLVVRSHDPSDPRLTDPAKRAALHRLPNYNGPNFIPFVLTPPSRVGFAYTPPITHRAQFPFRISGTH